jgi:hypothetical protein
MSSRLAKSFIRFLNRLSHNTQYRLSSSGSRAVNNSFKNASIYIQVDYRLSGKRCVEWAFHDSHTKEIAFSPKAREICELSGPEATLPGPVAVSKGSKLR